MDNNKTSIEKKTQTNTIWIRLLCCLYIGPKKSMLSNFCLIWCDLEYVGVTCTKK